MSNATKTTKITLSSLAARVEEMESQIRELQSKKTRKAEKDNTVSFVREKGKLTTQYRLTTYVGKAVYALGYHMKDALATYNYSGGIMNVSPEEQELFESNLVEFFSGDEEKGYKARTVKIEDGSIKDAIKAMKDRKAA